MKRIILVVLLIVVTSISGQNIFEGYRGYFPLTYEKKLIEIKNSPNLMFYTHKEVPPAFQIWDGANPGIFSTSLGINPNQFRPWKHTAGIDDCNNCKIIQFVILPEIGFIEWEIKKLNHDNSGPGTIIWYYPVGTLFGELLTVTNPRTQKDFTFEIRTLTRTEKRWQPNIYRPVEDLKQLYRILFAKGYNWDSNQLISRKRISDSFNIFTSEASFNTLGKFDDNLIETILTEIPFKSVRAVEWTTDCNAPTTNEDFHIIPKNYEGAFISVDSNVCASCHSTTLKHAKDINSDWAGRVRGSDGIFSFHIFDSESISTDGNSKNIKLRKQLIGRLREK